MQCLSMKAVLKICRLILIAFARSQSARRRIAERVLGEDQRAKHLREEELQLAAAALLVHASLIDGRADPEERRKLRSLLQARFNLGEDEFDRILGEAEAWEQESVDLYSFTSVLCRELDQEGRQRIVEMLWEIVLADGVLHEYEADLVSRGAELLGVSTMLLPFWRTP
jgi:uncharacterized tellurite resistance protein B-like protein